MKSYVYSLKTIECALFIILCCVSFSYSQQQQACTMDYQCGIPYGQCYGSVNDCPTTLSGVGINSASDRVYYGALCRDSTGVFSNTTIKSVSINGGTSTNVYTEPILRTPGNIVKVFAVVNNVLYYSRVQRQPGSFLEAFDLSSRQETQVTLNPGFFQNELEIANVASYTCQLDFANNSYSIVRFEGIVGQTASTTGNILYVLGSNQCGPIRRGTTSDLFFTSYTITPDPATIANYTTTFYRGTVSGSSNLPPALFTVAGQVTDFDVDSTGSIIIYGVVNNGRSRTGGLFRRVGTTTTQLNNEIISGVTIYNDTVYYNNEFTIRSTSLDGQNTVTLLQGTTGVCTCRPGFTGNNCQTCNGQVQWNQGFPSCIATNSAGVPVSCFEDYQCGNVPYIYCAVNVCACRTNFTGDRCSQCNGAVSWSNGIPSCSAN